MDVLYVDYSITEFVTLSLIVNVLPSDVETFPPQALKITLARVKPVSVNPLDPREISRKSSLKSYENRKCGSAWFFHHNSFNVEHNIISLQVTFILSVYVTSSEYPSVVSFSCFAELVRVVWDILRTRNKIR